jgi:hypothetical protein
MVLAVFSVSVWFWAQGNLLDTLKILACLLVPFTIATQRFLYAHALAKNHAEKAK